MTNHDHGTEHEHEHGPTTHTHVKPPWWPEDEPWPPGGWGPRRGPAARRARRRMRMAAAMSSGADSGSADDRPGSEWYGWPGWRRGLGCMVVLFATFLVSVGVLVLWVLSSLFGRGGGEGPLANLARPASLIVLVVGIIALAIGVRLARRVGRPLSELVDAANRIESADYTVRVDETPQGGSDLRGLSRAFNSMAERLESEDATRRRLLADVSHELRTPLAVIQGNLEALLDGVYPPDAAHIHPILEETRVLERLIDDLRTLSLAESGALPLHRELTDPDVLLDDVVSAHRARAAASGVTLSIAAGPDVLPIEIDPVRMRQVISNLVDNALRVMPSGGSITLRAASAASSVTLTVADDGPGIPAELLPNVFERFAKSPTSRGSGLGLAIARAIVEAHGGTIAAHAVEAPAPGHGTTISISLPNAAGT
ncbi:MAG TPA: ATP-binding protein [Candidatus Limnocylindrales bacterium]|nr:ATP-binding protein [Candidatus Limnocylindrales bacterium]